MPNRRPSFRVVAPSASPQEAAVVAAALEQFMRDTAPVRARARPGPGPWQRAALLEGVGRELHQPSPWVNSHPWGAGSP